MHPSQKINVETLLGRLPLFASLTPEELARVAAGTREYSVGKGDMLFHRGEQSTGIYLIAYGQIKLAFNSPNGNEKVIEILRQGQTFGEAVMFMETTYPVFAQALMDGLLLHISKQAIFNEIDHRPGFARKMIAGLAMRLHQMVHDVESYSLHSGKQRIIGYLLREMPESEEGQRSVTVTLPTSKGTIASRLNLTQEHFSRILAELIQEGLIEVDGRKIRVPDVAALLEMHA